jgi:mono/diheme cytochrome c family protein
MKQGTDYPRIGMRVTKRVALRFAATYFALYFLPFPVDALFESPGAPAWYARIWDPPVNALGRLLGIHAQLRTVDGPDGLGHYVQMACFAIVAAVAAGAWSVLDRRRPREDVHDLLGVWLRYVLAAWMFAFGLAKVIPSQMPLPDPAVLVMPYGESTAMKLLWTFMGTAPAYEQLTGAAELAGGLLVLSRRTAALGALVCAGVLANVVAMNVCYDVPVKIDASHLLMLSLFLLLPSARRLVDALVLGRAVPALVARTPLPSRWRRPLQALNVAFVAGVLYTQGAASAHHYYEAGDGAPLPDPYGIYDVEEMRRDDAVVAPLLTDATCWHRLYFGRRGAGVVYADGSRETLASPGTSRGTWSWARNAMTVSHAEDGHLLVEGVVDGKRIAVRARPTDPRNLRLVDGRFHWYFVDVAPEAAQARVDPPDELREAARSLLETNCGDCHTRGSPRALPRALAVYDLEQLDWSVRMSDEQLRDAESRLHGSIAPSPDEGEARPMLATAEQLAKFHDYLEREVARRAASR